MENLEELKDIEIDEKGLDLEEDVIQYECENCGSNMVYDPETKSLFCKSCKTTISFDVEEFIIKENDLLSQLAIEKEISIDENSSENEICCKNCGAVSIFDGEVFSDKCIYCGSSYVYTKDNDNYIKAEYVLPFEVSETMLRGILEKFGKKNFFMNKEFKEHLTKGEVFGVYIPYWTYDTGTTSIYNAMRGDYYYIPVTKIVDGKSVTTMERRTRWTRVQGSYKLFFDDIVVSGVNKEDFIYQNLANTFNTKAVVPYDSKYLLGFSARKYDVEVKDGWETAKELSKPGIEGGIRTVIGGDTVKNLNYVSEYNDVTFKHTLLPVWISTYNFKEKVYRITINGQMGKVVGKYPLSYGRIALVTILSIIALIVFMYMLKI